jgi:hypothetical protein
MASHGVQLEVMPVGKQRQPRAGAQLRGPQQTLSGPAVCASAAGRVQPAGHALINNSGQSLMRSPAQVTAKVLVEVEPASAGVSARAFKLKV